MPGLLALIEELEGEHGSVNAAARAIGMPQATLHNIKKGASPTLETLRLIARARGQTLTELMGEIEDRGDRN